MSAVPVADALTFLDADDEPLVQLLLDASEEMIADFIGSPIAPTPVVERHRGTGTIVLRHPWLTGVPVVTDGDGAAVTGYVLSPGGLLVSDGYGSHTWLTVAYTAGFAPLPAAVKLAVLYTTQHAYDAQRGSVPVPFQAGADETFTVSRGFALPNRAKELLAPWARAASIA